jgi:hypothetical protein
VNENSTQTNAPIEEKNLPSSADAQESDSVSSEKTNIEIKTNQTVKCSENSVYSIAQAKCLPLPTAMSIEPFSISQAVPPFTSDADNYAYGTAVPMETRNLSNSTIYDHTLYSGNTAVTFSVALAEAIASIEYKGFELISSGGHGSAVQIISHDWNYGKSANECENPTEAGNISDDEGKAFPYH